MVISSAVHYLESLQAGVKDAPRVVDDYDRAVRELLFERRGQPADRMKSEIELAREERERLEKHEVCVRLTRCSNTCM